MAVLRKVGVRTKLAIFIPFRAIPRQLVDELAEEAFVPSTLEGYSWVERTSDYGGVSQRWVVFVSNSAARVTSSHWTNTWKNRLNVPKRNSVNCDSRLLSVPPMPNRRLTVWRTNGHCTNSQGSWWSVRLTMAKRDVPLKVSPPHTTAIISSPRWCHLHWRSPLLSDGPGGSSWPPMS